MKIYLDPGHGGNDSGAIGNGLLEKNVTLKIALGIRKYLSEYSNVAIRMSRTNDRTVSLHSRTNDANSWGADFFLSVHINAGRGTGFESYIYSGLSNSSQAGKIRDPIHEKVARASGLIDRGKKRANYHVIREARMPAVLTENGFIDTSSDANKMKDPKWINQVAKAHAEGIAKAFNLRKSSSATVSNPAEMKPKPKNKVETYVLSKSVPGYYTANDAKLDKNRRTTVQAGTYYVFKRQEGMINVTSRLGTQGSWINPSSATKDFKAGDRVKIKQSAKTYATGEKIPSWVKNSRHTIQKVTSNRVLLKEINSWVRKSDISK